jgi:hypothetical protein
LTSFWLLWCLNLKRGNFKCTDQSVGVANQLQHLASIIQVLDPKLHDHLGKKGYQWNFQKSIFSSFANSF